MIYFIDPGGYLRYVNEYAAASMRARPEDLIGKHLTDLFRPDIAQKHIEGILAVISNHKPSRLEMFELCLPGRSGSMSG